MEILVPSHRKYVGLIISGVVLALGLAATTPRARADDLKGTLKARYEAMKVAMAAHDGAAFAAILASDFTSVDVMGNRTGGADMIREVNSLKADPNKISHTELISLEPEPGYVIVEQRYDMKTLKRGTDGKNHHVELVSVSTDKWVKPKSEWLIEETVTDEVSYFLDGRRVAHKVKASSAPHSG